ncbi:bifunctional DedA family/phosphatase PAP2 family protein [Pseudomonas sp. ZM23]|uniref:Bifunctional DedA family/phosphatase PAP2 family protein n=1 Tax=Pseudomonas triclosanedens TaxID=2961893 RepID=A0ABY7A2R1_9PSED|nr:bifunctional DedA family/phosphatase PAP2 family protein [Pseudomonas triclosanedens]MCP8464100.1 bifunctional DedA family/phosphatase PAP2 family protein [Pseudomonas triclosanedens]MCP8469184.1 bifunctional DedA family/phosphatase PAP2 family protein [Pseudomonas triclosanedens]MCP8475906.1 bifunctional DedA family/phosphatase PAP2 family protein [Pseudomonas triclosanedens]WAI50394.1 bifunctional DedA family/phosphatase PAP2 family protein [Pseudomonas triclosanedens]
MIDLAAFNTWMATHPQWLAGVLFLVAFLECAAIVGIILPGVVMLFAIAVLAGSGTLGLGETLLLAFTGGLLGDLSSYWIGRHFHQDIRRLPILRHHPEWMASAEGFFARYGVASLLVGRFIGALRPFLPMIAGMLDMPFGRFLAVSIVAAAGWSIAYLVPGWATGAAMRLPLPEGFWMQAGIVAACLAVALALVIHAELRRQRNASLIAASAGIVLLAGMLIGWPHLDALDHGLMALVQEHRRAWLDEVMVAVTRVGDFRTQFIAGALIAVLLAAMRLWRHAIFAAGTMIGTALLNNTLKHFFGRARPEVIADPLSAFSMPSGHASASFAFFLVLGVLASREKSPRVRLTWMLLAIIPAASIALSRVYLGAHWPSDIIAGALLGSSVCAAALWLSEQRLELPALTQRIWWSMLSAAVAVLAIASIWGLTAAVHRYQPL